MVELMIHILRKTNEAALFLSKKIYIEKVRFEKKKQQKIKSYKLFRKDSR